MRFETKIALVIRDDLATWQKLNVAAFLAGGLVGRWPELAGEPYRDGSDRHYGSLIRQPILVFASDATGLTRSLGRARDRGLVPSIYTRELFTTGHDEENRAAVARVGTEQLDLVGLGLHGERKEIDKIVKGLALHG